ncbi:hypothetical protein V6N12_018039 [Hibiscus sabdariffa]|uniref:Uncharacterized protein n=1 Tax=Hibiscus sabdariffa TaxID=183260 RepID=A0ABR2A6M1_9ROSI
MSAAKADVQPAATDGSGFESFGATVPPLDSAAPDDGVLPPDGGVLPTTGTSQIGDSSGEARVLPSEEWGAGLVGHSQLPEHTDASQPTQELLGDNSVHDGAYDTHDEVDADWKSCPDDRRSTSGSYVFLGNRLVT